LVQVHETIVAEALFVPSPYPGSYPGRGLGRGFTSRASIRVSPLSHKRFAIIRSENIFASERKDFTAAGSGTHAPGKSAQSYFFSGELKKPEEFEQP
jgi:hypothetical protein